MRPQLSSSAHPKLNNQYSGDGVLPGAAAVEPDGMPSAIAKPLRATQFIPSSAVLFSFSAYITPPPSPPPKVSDFQDPKHQRRLTTANHDKGFPRAGAKEPDPIMASADSAPRFSLPGSRNHGGSPSEHTPLLAAAASRGGQVVEAGGGGNAGANRVNEEEQRAVGAGGGGGLSGAGGGGGVETTTTTFVRNLGAVEAFAIVVSIVIGSGVFTSPGSIDTNVPSPGAALVVWLVGGALAWTGASTMAELGTAIPGEGRDRTAPVVNGSG